MRNSLYKTPGSRIFTKLIGLSDFEHCKSIYVRFYQMELIVFVYFLHLNGIFKLTCFNTLATLMTKFQGISNVQDL